MLTTIKGIYSNGQIILAEPPPTENPSEVFVAFTGIMDESTSFKERKAGFGKGSLLYIATDFDEPLDDLKEYMQ